MRSSVNQWGNGTVSECKKILLVEDHPLVLEILTLVVKATFPSSVVYTAGGLNDALEVKRRESDLDLIVFDLLLPDAGNVDALRRLIQTWKDVPILVFSAIEDPEVIQAVLDAGATGYAPKTTTRPVLSHALRLVTSGGRYIPPQALAQKAPKPAPPPRSRLTRRQIEVLQFVSEGFSNKEIADKMGITVETVKQHLQGLYTALGATSRMRAVVIARRLGIDFEDHNAGSL